MANRYRRNQKRIRSRKIHGKLRRKDAQKMRAYEKFWIEECTRFCICQAPHDRPCDGVLAGGMCDELGHEPRFDVEDEIEL